MLLQKFEVRFVKISLSVEGALRLAGEGRFRESEDPLHAL